jgi:hypothetical protein
VRTAESPGVCKVVKRPAADDAWNPRVCSAGCTAAAMRVKALEAAIADEVFQKCRLVAVQAMKDNAQLNISERYKTISFPLYSWSVSLSSDQQM